MAGTGHTSVRSYKLYIEDTTPVAGAFADKKIPFIDQVDATPFMSMSVTLTNDNALGGDYLQFSYDGTTVNGKLFPQEKLSFDFTRETQIFLKSPGATPFRLWSR